jgi:GNAT superfamily N-acetyltransferase
MSNTEALQQDAKALHLEVAAQAKDLAQEQLNNLSARLFEVGKKADQQLTTWLVFAALTPLILFGASEDTTVGGVNLDPLVAGAATYILSCAFYYRANLSSAALGHWRRLLKRQRRERFALFYQVARNSYPDDEQLERELDAFIAEYPGYLACSVLVKDAARREGTLSGKYIGLVHNLVILGYVLAPYALAAGLLYASWFSWWLLATTVVGLMITVSGNVIMQHDADTEYKIRSAEKADLAALPDIERAASRLFPEGRLPDPGDTMPMEELERAQEQGLVLVAANEGRIVGFTMSKVHDNVLHLHVMAVHPDHGKRGVGTQLVAAVIQQAAQRGLMSVTLTTFEDHPFNAPFYAKSGFRTLHDAELSPMLRGILAQEANLGMTNRVAMVRSPVS